MLIGLLLGVVSHLEETRGFDVGINSDGTWIAAAFVAGSAGRGALTLTVANAAYYAAGATTPVWWWFALGVAGGALFGAAGVAWRTGRPAIRFAAALALGGVLIADGIELRTVPDAVKLAIGAALPVLGAPRPLPAAAVSATVVAIATTGAFDPLLP